MPERYLAQTVAAVGKARKPVLVWLQFQDLCRLLRSRFFGRAIRTSPIIVLDLLSWEYHEVLLAKPGGYANALLDRIVKDEKGKYLVVVEGAIPTAEGGIHCMINGHACAAPSAGSRVP